MSETYGRNPKCWVSLTCQHVETKLDVLCKDRIIFVLESLKHEGAVPEEEKSDIVQSSLCIHPHDRNV